MALIDCPECGAQVSEKATSCVNCGHPVELKKCAECGDAVPRAATKCPTCGHPFEAHQLAHPYAATASPPHSFQGDRSPIGWYFAAFERFAEFGGRSRRKEYWWFYLFNVLAMLALLMVDAALGTADLDAGIGLLSGLYVVGVLIPTLAVTVRRLHDTGRSGWWLLIVLLPLIGPVVLFVFTVLDSEPATNRFGPNPKVAVPS